MNPRLAATLISATLAAFPSENFSVTTCRNDRFSWEDLARMATTVVMGEIVVISDLRWVPCDDGSRKSQESALIAPGSCHEAFQVRFRVRSQRTLKGSAPDLITFTGELPVLYAPVCGEEPKLEPGLGVVVFLEASSDGLHLLGGCNGLGYTKWGRYSKIDWPSLVAKGIDSVDVGTTP